MTRKNFAATGLVRRRRPAARARPARLREPARVQHLPQPPPARLGARRRPRPRLRRGACPQPRHDRVLLGRSAPAADAATCRSPTSTVRAAMAEEAIEMGAAALLVASGCPPGHSPSHRGLDPVWALAEEADIPVVFHVGGTGDLIDRTTSTTACRSRPTSTAARRTSARSTTWRSRSRRCRRWRR